MNDDPDGAKDELYASRRMKAKSVIASAVMLSLTFAGCASMSRPATVCRMLHISIRPPWVAVPFERNVTALATAVSPTRPPSWPRSADALGVDRVGSRTAP